MNGKLQFKVKLDMLLYTVLLGGLATYFPFLRSDEGYLIVYFLFTVTGFVFLLEQKYQKRVIYNFINSYKYLLFYMIFISIVFLNIVNFNLGFDSVIRYTGYVIGFIFGFYFLPVLLTGNYNKLRTFLIRLGVFLGVVTLGDYILGAPLTNLGFDSYRHYSTVIGRLPGFRSLVHNVNNFGIIVMFSLFASVSRWFEKSRKVISFDFAIVLFLFFILLFSWARSAYVGFFVMSLVYFIIHFKKKFFLKKLLILVLLGLFIMGLLTPILLNHDIDPYSVAHNFMQLDKGTPRWEMNRAQFDVFRVRPILGHGPEDQSILLNRYSDFEGPTGHNTYLRILLISGGVGFFFYMLIIFNIVKTGYKNINSEYKWIFCMIAGYLVQSYFESGTIGGVGYISLLVSFLMGTINYLSFSLENMGK